MIPIRLNLRNFMCYTDVHEPLEFDGIQVACLVGQNGHGKSALLDAITWALWGKARARTADELIYQGSGVTEMEVEYEFRLGASHYRVIRKRHRRGRGQSVLELAVKDPESGAFRALTGNNLTETERQIEQLLRMSYETFTNSSFLLQGRADSFTTKAPAERKQILAEILDLSYYDRLEARARQKSSQRNEQQAVLRQQIEDDDLELKRQPELRDEQARLEKELTGLEERLRLSEARYETLRERLNRLKSAQRELEEQERRLEEARTRADRQRRRLVAAEAALQRANATLERADEIEAGFAELTARRAELDGLGIRQAEHGRLAYELSCMQRIIAQERGRLEGRLKQLSTQLNGGSVNAEQLERLRRELAAARTEQAELGDLEATRAKLADQLTQARERYAELKAHCVQYEARLTEARQRHQLLESSPTCPVCRTALGADRHRQVLEQYRCDEGELASKLQREQHEQRELHALGTSLKEQLGGLDQQLARRSESQERVARAERALARAEEQLRALETIKTETHQVEHALTTNNYAVQERQEIVKLERQVMTLGYDATAHKAIAEAATELARFEALRQDLVEARRAIVREEQARAEATEELSAWEKAVRAAEDRRSELRAETADLPTVETAWTESESQLRGLRLEHGRLREDLGAVRQHLSTMEFTRKRREERLTELNQVLKERSIYQTLIEAFGKKGIQAMLIETAIPELQDEANRLLSLMSDGRMQLSFETQREARSGDSTIETLDIVIRDELGERAYELYSGGEAFRVNFAIRIALSKLLAQRAGTKLQTLVIDEGFGSQDEQGRDRLVEAIKVIQPEFEKILIITHLNDLKELFPVRIEVSKTPAGSLIHVS
jgi:DNA repair protein SbcC/Rad50